MPLKNDLSYQVTPIRNDDRVRGDRTVVLLFIALAGVNVCVGDRKADRFAKAPRQITKSRPLPGRE
jgi:hypothetical protein